MWYFPEIPESSGWLIIKSLLLWHPGWQVNVWKSVWHGAIIQYWVEWKFYHKSCPSAILSLPGCRTRSTSVGCLPWPQTSTWRWTASPIITGVGGVRTTTSPPGEDETPFKSLKIPFFPLTSLYFHSTHFLSCLLCRHLHFAFFFLPLTLTLCRNFSPIMSAWHRCSFAPCRLSEYVDVDQLAAHYRFFRLISPHLCPPFSTLWLLFFLPSVIVFGTAGSEWKALKCSFLPIFYVAFVSAQLKIPYSGRQ